MSYEVCKNFQLITALTLLLEIPVVSGFYQNFPNLSIGMMIYDYYSRLLYGEQYLGRG